MTKLVLNAQSRSVIGKKCVELREKGILPATVYGHNKKNESIQVNAADAEAIYSRAGKNKIIGLKIDDGRAKNVVIYDAQREALQGAIIHLDLYIVKMDEELKAEVPVHFIGESTAVYKDEGILLKNTELVEVECLPSLLPDSFTVDISVLDDFDKSITLGDLELPEGVKLTAEDLDTVIAKVEPPRTNAELAELDEEITEELPVSEESDEGLGGDLESKHEAEK